MSIFAFQLCVFLLAMWHQGTDPECLTPSQLYKDIYNWWNRPNQMQTQFIYTALFLRFLRLLELFVSHALHTIIDLVFRFAVWSMSYFSGVGCYFMQLPLRYTAPRDVRKKTLTREAAGAISKPTPPTPQIF